MVYKQIVWSLLLYKRRGIGPEMRVLGICAWAFSLAMGKTLLAQPVPVPIPSEMVEVSIDSGVVSATEV